MRAIIPENSGDTILITQKSHTCRCPRDRLIAWHPSALAREVVECALPPSMLRPDVEPASEAQTSGTWRVSGVNGMQAASVAFLYDQYAVPGSIVPGTLRNSVYASLAGAA